MSSTNQVTVTVGDDGNVSAVKFSNEQEQRSAPNGNLSKDPMPTADYPTLVGFQNVTVMVFENQAGAKRICVKLMNCDWFCR